MSYFTITLITFQRWFLPRSTRHHRQVKLQTQAHPGPFGGSGGDSSQREPVPPKGPVYIPQVKVEMPVSTIKAQDQEAADVDPSAKQAKLTVSQISVNERDWHEQGAN